MLLLVRKVKDKMIELFNDDCIKILKQMKKGSIDCVITDCPYHIVSGGCSQDKDLGGIFSRGKKGNLYRQGTKHVSLSGILNDSDPSTYARQGKLFKYNDIKFKDWLPYAYDVLKDDSHCYIMINARNLKDLWVEAEKVGFKFQQLIVWDKGNSTPNKYYLNSYELILMFRKGKAKDINNMGTKNILKINNIRGNKMHPTEKPVELMKILIENSTQEKETVLDLFMGGGSTGIACKETNRNFIGIEIDERYYNIAKERLNYEENDL